MYSQRLPLSDIRQISLGDIYSVHPSITSIWDEIGSDLPVIHQPRLDSQRVLDALEVVPIVVSVSSNKTYCVAGTDQYRFACSQLPKETLIPVRFIEGNRRAVLNRLIAIDLFISQVINLKPKMHHKWMYKSWIYISEYLTSINPLDCEPNKSGFAKAFKIDVRGL